MAERVRVPREFREQHVLIPRGRRYVGSTHSTGVTVPAFRYPWRCSCGAEGKDGGAGGHRDHVVGLWLSRPSCPDGGTCHHECGVRCFRVHCCEPLSGVFEGDEWPEGAKPVRVVGDARH